MAPLGTDPRADPWPRDTLRAMWFYQGTDVAKASLWFHSLASAVQRTIDMEGVDWPRLRFRAWTPRTLFSLPKSLPSFSTLHRKRSPGAVDLGPSGGRGPRSSATQWANEPTAITLRSPSYLR